MKTIIINIGLLLFCIIINAQNQFTNYGNLKMNPGSSVTFFGNLTNNGTIMDSAQAVTFKGSSIQNIDGSTATTFNNMIIDNVNGVALQQNLMISNSLALTLGSMNLNSTSLTINNNSSAGISRTDGYIMSEQTNNSGKIIWNIGNVIGSHVYPFGTSEGTYIPFTLDLTEGNIGNVTVSTYPTNNDNTPYPSVPVPVTNLYDINGNENSANTVDRFWQINKDGVSGTATLTFTATASEIGSLANLNAQKWDDSTDSWDAPLTGQTNTLNTATVSGVTLFSQWILSGNSSALPVELLTFTGECESQNITLKWSTASENNNKYFNVERSEDGQNWVSIANIDGAGNSNILSEYEFIDKDLHNKVSYYRLKQIDFNGKLKHPALISVKSCNDNAFTLSIYPNPTSETLNLEFAGEKQDVSSIEIFDEKGSKVYHADGYQQSIVVSNNPAGSYFVYFNLPTETITEKFIVTK